jgi:hypothetical protein
VTGGRGRLLRAALLGAVLPAGAASAQIVTIPSLTVTAGGAYSTSPFLQEDGRSTGAASTQLDIQPSVQLIDGTATAVISGNYNRSDYFSRYGSNSGYGVSASANKQLNPRASVGAIISFDSSVLGANRGFITPATLVPTLPGSGIGTGIGTGSTGTGTVVPTTPVTTVPQVPVTGVFDPTGIDGDVGLIGARQRRNQLTVGLNGSYSLDPRSSWNFGVNASRSTYPGNRVQSLLVSDYNDFGGNIGYTRSLTEVSNIGFQVSGSHAEYGNGRTSEILTPRLTYGRTLSERWTLSAAAGAGISRGNLGSSGTRVILSVDGSLCRSGERLSGCITGARVPTLSGIGGVRIQNTVSTSFSYRINPYTSAGLVGSYSHIGGGDSDPLVPDFALGAQDLFSANASLQRQLNRRLSLVGSVGYQYVNGSFSNGTEDITARLGLSLAIGRFQ